MPTRVLEAKVGLDKPLLRRLDQLGEHMEFRLFRDNPAIVKQELYEQGCNLIDAPNWAEFAQKSPRGAKSRVIELAEHLFYNHPWSIYSFIGPD